MFGLPRSGETGLRCVVVYARHDASVQGRNSVDLRSLEVLGDKFVQ